MKIPILSWVLKKFIGLLHSLRGTGSEIKKIQEMQVAKALFFFKNGGVVFLSGIITPDFLFFIPYGIKRKYRIRGEYILYPDNSKFFIILDEGIETIDLKSIPKTKKIKKMEIDYNVNEKGKVIETVNMIEYNIKGADELSSMAYLIAKLSPLSYMNETSKKELLLIVLLAIFAGIIIGGFGVLAIM